MNANPPTPTDSNTAPGAALVIGAGGGLGQALVQALTAGNAPHGCARILSLGRSTVPALDYDDEASLSAAAAWVAQQCAEQAVPLRLLIVATGFLHGEPGLPERSWSQLDANYLNHVFRINAIGPALVMKHFLPLMPKQGRCVAGFVSAKVGSIGDNALGGWYGYRASKAALNQLVKTAAIELTRRNRLSVCVALHPGTIDTALSQRFAKTGLTVRTPASAAAELLAVLAHLQAKDSGALIDYTGKALPW